VPDTARRARRFIASLPVVSASSAARTAPSIAPTAGAVVPFGNHVPRTTVRPANPRLRRACGAIDGAVLAALLALTTAGLAMNRRARRAVSGTR